MAISYAVNSEYQFFWYYNATSVVAAATAYYSLSARNQNPEGLFSLTKRLDIEPIPEAYGGIPVGDGKADAEPMQFFMEAHDQTNHADTLFLSMANQVSNMLEAGDYQYIKAQLYDGSSTHAYRKYVRFRGLSDHYVSKTLYKVIRGSLVFPATDPLWYLDSVSSDSVTVSGGTGSKVTTDGGVFQTRRVIVVITKTGASNPTDVNVVNVYGKGFTMAGSLANVNDYWIIDCYNGTVFKSVSGVLSNDIANFSGSVMPISGTTDTITVTDGGTASFAVTLLWLPRVI